MCECLCGEFEAYKAFRVGELVLAVEIYHGCPSCNNPIDVALHLMTPEYAKEWDIDVEQAPEFKPDKHGHNQVYFPLIGGDDLVAWTERHELDFSGYDNPIDYLRDNGLELLQGGLENRLDKVKKTEDKSK